MLPGMILAEAPTPYDAAALIDYGDAMLADVREADEYAARHIPG